MFQNQNIFLDVSIKLSNFFKVVRGNGNGSGPSPSNSSGKAQADKKGTEMIELRIKTDSEGVAML